MHGSFEGYEHVSYKILWYLRTKTAMHLALVKQFAQRDTTYPLGGWEETLHIPLGGEETLHSPLGGWEETLHSPFKQILEMKYIVHCMNPYKYLDSTFLARFEVSSRS